VVIGPAHDFLLPVPQAHVLAALRAVWIDAELFNPHNGAVAAYWPSHLEAPPWKRLVTGLSFSYRPGDRFPAPQPLAFVEAMERGPPGLGE
jgi:hypothetical protein